MGITCPGQVLTCLSYQKIRGEFFFLFWRERKDLCYFSGFLKIIWLFVVFFSLENEFLLKKNVLKTMAGLTFALLVRT